MVWCTHWHLSRFLHINAHHFLLGAHQIAGCPGVTFPPGHVDHVTPGKLRVRNHLFARWLCQNVRVSWPTWPTCPVLGRGDKNLGHLTASFSGWCSSQTRKMICIASVGVFGLGRKQSRKPRRKQPRKPINWHRDMGLRHANQNANNHANNHTNQDANNHANQCASQSRPERKLNRYATSSGDWSALWAGLVFCCSALAQSVASKRPLGEETLFRLFATIKPVGRHLKSSFRPISHDRAKSTHMSPGSFS
jgi:hypothetical protein